MKKHQFLKRFSACVMVVIMTLTAVPLSGLVGLEMPKWSQMFATKASAVSGDFIYTVSDGGEATITGYNTSISGKLVIPDKLGGYPVTSIGDFAFSGCTGLTGVTIPNSVTSIGNYAFYGCTGLTEITIPDSVTSIGFSAFYNCTGLTSATIPDSVTSIGSSAFYNCTSLTSITIPNNLESLGGNRVFYNTPWYNEFYNAQPDGSIYIGKVYYKYKGTMLENTSVVIKDGTKGIAGSAFSKCDGLTGITIPDSVTNIDDYAFDGCTGLTSVTIPDSVTSIGSSAFGDCIGLTSVTIPYSVTRIGGSAFDNCTNLKSVTIGNSVTSIGSDAFNNCTSLTKINWNAESVSDFDSYNIAFCNAGTAGDGINIIFGDNVKRIPAYVFYADFFWERPNIKSVTIGNSVTSIGECAFSRCTGLTSVTIGNSVTSIGNYAFEDCSGLTSVTIPDSVTGIGDFAFEYCTSLDLIKFEGKPPAFSDNTFYRCSTNALYPYGISEWKSAIKSDYGGSIKWVSYSKGTVTDLGIKSLPKKTVYYQGETADYTGLSLSAKWSDGLTEVVTPYSKIYDITFSGFSTETPGLKTVTATYGGKSVQFEIGVHKTSVFTEEKEKYPESAHNYADNLNETKTYKCPDAFKLVVTFSDKTFVEKDGDYIYVNGKKYTGDELKGKTLTINGDTLTVKLVSDGYGNYYGYSIDKIEVTKIEHEEVVIEEVKPTCTAKGKTEGKKCSICGKVIIAQTTISATGHTYKTTTTKATTTKDGKAVTACTVCGEVSGTVTIYKASSIKLSKTSYTYNGKVQKPTVTVKDSKGKTLKNGTDYTVSYASGCKNTGKYAVKITFKGNYSGTKTLYFNILPSKTSKLSVSQTTSSIKATWKAVTGATGYKVTLYNAKGKAVKTVDTTKTTYTFSKLSKGTTYKVRVTAYKTIDGKKVSSSVYTQLITATKPGTPSLKVTAGTKKASLSWNKQTGASGYVVYMATSKNGTYKKIATVKGGTKVSYTKTGLTKGKTYYFKVRAYVAPDSMTTVYGDYSSVKYAKIK